MKSVFKLSIQFMPIIFITMLSSCKSKYGNGDLISDTTNDSASIIDPSPVMPIAEPPAENSELQKVEGFNEACYLERYPDVASIWVQGESLPAVLHYINFGKNENRIPGCDPSPVNSFDEQCYLQNNLDVQQIWVNQEKRPAVEHYILFGRSENRKFSCLHTAE